MHDQSVRSMPACVIRIVTCADLRDGPRPMMLVGAMGRAHVDDSVRLASHTIAHPYSLSFSTDRNVSPPACVSDCGGVVTSM
jgi:hypothetical protein